MSSFVNIQDALGNTSLHLCANNKAPDNIKVATMLVKAKTNLNIKNNDGDTPLDIAIRSAKISKCYDVVTLIQNHLTDNE